MEKQYCLQCGAELMLDAVPVNPDLATSQTVPACHACRSRAYNVPGNKLMELTEKIKLMDDLITGIEGYCVLKQRHVACENILTMIRTRPWRK